MVLALRRRRGSLERNSLSGEQLPGARATVHIDPAHNGETLTGSHVQGHDGCRRAMPWEALCLLLQVWPRND